MPAFLRILLITLVLIGLYLLTGRYHGVLRIAAADDGIQSAPAETIPAEEAAQQSTPPPDNPEESTGAIVNLPASYPNEEPLWDMFHAGKYSQVLQEIARLQKEYPGWNPSRELMDLVTRESTQAEIREAVAAGDPERLIQAARKHRNMFTCTHLDWAWSLADAYATRGQADELFALLAGLIDKCEERDRLATLPKAPSWLDEDSWDRLAARESTRSRSRPVDAEFRRMRYDQKLKRLLAVKDAADKAEFFQRLQDLSTEILYYRDVNIALLAGWSFFNTGNTGDAALWFGRAKDWQPDNADALHGLALCAQAEKRYGEARNLAGGLPDDVEGKQEILRNANLGLAQEEYGKDNFAGALQYLNAAGGASELPRYARLMAAWSLLRMGDAPQALERFRQVHGEHPDEESAQGVFNAAIQTVDPDKLECSPPDPYLSPLFQKYCADRSFAQKRFLTAHSLAPEHYGSTGSMGTPRLAWYLSLRRKTGDSGLSKLDDLVNSLEAVWPVTDRSEISFRIDHHQLDSDSFNRNARLSLSRGLLTGALGIADDSTAFPALAETGADVIRITGTGAEVDVWEPHVTWRSESRFDLEAGIGLSVLGGEVSPRLIGHASIGDRGAWGNFTLIGYARPVRESILAYSGWRLDRFDPDTPFNGRKWGGVRAVGTDLSGYLSLGNSFGFTGKIGVEQIDARNVRKNIHPFLQAGINRNLGLSGFDYFAAGITAAYDHYQRNLSQFTPGHGGYFSPQSFLQLKANLDFLTKENRTTMIKGHLDAGRVYKRESMTPIIPLSGYSENGDYPGSKEWGWAYTVELEGAIQVSKHLQLGTQISYRAAPQYDETAAVLFLRVLFDGRSSVLSSDLGGRVLDDVR